MKEAEFLRRARHLARDTEEETGEAVPLDVAGVLLDRHLEAHGERVAGQGWCDGGYCCSGTHLDVRDAERLTIVAEAAERDADLKAAEEERLDCAAGICDHYTCTEGWALVEWEADRRVRGLDR